MINMEVLPLTLFQAVPESEMQVDEVKLVSGTHFNI